MKSPGDVNMRELTKQKEWNGGRCIICDKILVPDIQGGWFHCPACKARDERDLKLIVKALRIIRNNE